VVLGGEELARQILFEDFSESDAVSIENMANGIVFSNLPVTARVVTQEELESIPLRKKPKVTENIRIVEVKDTQMAGTAAGPASVPMEMGMPASESALRLRCACPSATR